MPMVPGSSSTCSRRSRIQASTPSSGLIPAYGTIRWGHFSARTRFFSPLHRPSSKTLSMRSRWLTAMSTSDSENRVQASNSGGQSVQNASRGIDEPFVAKRSCMPQSISRSANACRFGNSPSFLRLLSATL